MSLRRIMWCKFGMQALGFASTEAILTKELSPRARLSSIAMKIKIRTGRDAPNKSLQPTATPLRGLSAAEFQRWNSQ